MKTILIVIAITSSLCLYPQVNNSNFDLKESEKSSKKQSNNLDILNYNKVPIGIHPFMDGNCTFYLEWDSAKVRINKQVGKRGAICREYQNDWVATSSKDGNKIVYSGVTLFELHDFWDADTYEIDDFNKFGWTVDPTLKNPNFSLIAWVFDDINEPDDKWLRHRTTERDPFTGLWSSHLCNRSGLDHIDDRGFIVRLNKDPNTDIQWLPGDPEPGDFRWRWPDYHGFYGKFDFNQSSRINAVAWAWEYFNVMNTPGQSTPNEVYEFCLHGGIGGKGGDDSSTYKPCIHTMRVLDHYDPHNGQSYYVDIIVIDGPGHVKKPKPPDSLPPFPPNPGGGHGGKNPGGNHLSGFPGNVLLVPGQYVNTYYDLSNTGVVGGNFLITIQDNELLDGDIVSSIFFEALERKTLRYEFAVPPDIPIGSVHRFNFDAVTEEHPEQTDSFYIDHIVSAPSNNLIWAPAGVNMESPMTIMNGLASMGHFAELHQILPDPTILFDFDVIWVCLGTAPDYQEIDQGSPEYLSLLEYLNSGGSVYLEGGSFWNTASNELLSLFNIHSESTFYTNIEKVVGYQFFKLMDFSREESMQTLSTDKLRIATNNYCETPGFYGNLMLFNDEGEDYSFMIYNDSELTGRRTVGSSIELGSLKDFELSGYSKNDLINRLLYLLLPPQVEPALMVMAVMDNAEIFAGESVSFFGFSEPDADQWNWHFEGADPSYSARKSPEEIYYYMPGVYDVKLSANNTFARGGVVIENAITVMENIPPGWEPSPSPNWATVNVPLEINPSINDVILKPGDIIGAFHKDLNLSDKCAGYCIWPGNQSVSFIISGDIFYTIFKEGFSEGEEIVFKIYSMAEQMEYRADGITADYNPAYFSQGEMITLELLKAVFEQDYFLFDGWQGFSSFIIPKQGNIPEIFSQISENMIFFGNNYSFWWPSQGINTFDNWMIQSGYKMKLESTATFHVSGYIRLPGYSILDQGWSLLPVFSDVPVSVEDLFADVEELEIVYDVAGMGVYWPRFNINQLYSLKPGKSYWIMLNEPANINFEIGELKSLSDDFTSVNEIQSLNPWSSLHPTTYQHIIGISGNALSKIPAGSILGAFTLSGLCAGTIDIADNNPVAITLFGDDPLTPVIDGFEAEEMISYRIYNPKTGEIFETLAQYDETLDHSGKFSSQGLSAIEDFKVAPARIFNPDMHLIKIYPNPTYCYFNIAGSTEEATIKVLSAYGSLILTKYTRLPAVIDLSSQPKGVYFISVKTDKQVFYEKVIRN
ncbi:MAG: T9SS type A sorting domain-containing protein [Bacteroidales bacterium]|nr:T9SS type A sorting domain-containing protein [Bacteroidales bacterium]